MPKSYFTSRKTTRWNRNLLNIVDRYLTQIKQQIKKTLCNVYQPWFDNQGRCFTQEDEKIQFTSLKTREVEQIVNDLIANEPKITILKPRYPERKWETNIYRGRTQ